MAFLDQFTKGVRIAYPHIRMGVAAGMSANKIINMLKVSGIGVRKQDGLRVIKALKASTTLVSNYLTSNPTDKPIAELIPPTFTDQAKRYRYVVEGDMFDPLQEVQYEKHITIESNFLMEQGDILSLGRELIRGNSADFGADVGEVRISLIEDSFAPVILPS